MTDWAAWRAERLPKLISALRDGNFREVACRHAGITDRVLRKWMQRAEDGEPEYVALMEQVHAAESEAEMRSVAIIRSMEKGWLAHAWWLERAKQTRWGSKKAPEDRAENDAEEATDEEIDAAALERVRARGLKP